MVKLKQHLQKQMNKYIGLIKKISSRLEELTHYEKCSYDVLLEAQHYSITAGGKHLRGLILLETAKLGGAQAETVLDFACAMELVHTYSLIHDDLPEMDNDYLRRGKPTCHVKFGADIALLAGDALLTKAFSVIVGNRFFSDHKKTECVGYIVTVDGIAIYFAGDTGQTEQMTHMSERKLDYAILPMDFTYTMDIDETICCAKLIAAKHTIPVHMSPGNLFDSDRANKFVTEGALIVKPGETISL